MCLSTLTVLKFLVWVVNLSCILMAAAIVVGLERPFPPWVIPMCTTHGLGALYDYFYHWCELPTVSRGGEVFMKHFQNVLAVAWVVTAGLMLKDHPNCTSASAWFQSFLPAYPISGYDPEDIAYIKCIFGGFQLALGCGAIATVGIVLIKRVLCCLVKDCNRTSRTEPVMNTATATPNAQTDVELGTV